MKPARFTAAAVIATAAVLAVGVGQARQSVTPQVVPAPQGTHTENGLAGYAKIPCSGVFVSERIVRIKAVSRAPGYGRSLIGRRSPSPTALRRTRLQVLIKWSASNGQRTVHANELEHRTAEGGGCARLLARLRGRQPGNLLVVDDYFRLPQGRCSG